MNNNIGSQAVYQMGSALHQYNIDDINSAINSTKVGEMGSICIP